MNARLTLGEKLKDLWTAKKLKLDDILEATILLEVVLQHLDYQAH